MNRSCYGINKVLKVKPLFTRSMPIVQQIFEIFSLIYFQFGTFDSAMHLITKNLNSLRDQSATYRWAYYSPNPSALSQIAKMVDDGKVR